MFGLVVNDRINELKLGELMLALGQRAHLLNEEIETLYHNEKIWQRLKELSIILDNAMILFDEDRAQVLKWIATPNSHFFMFSPFDFTMAGHAHTIIERQRSLL